MTVKFVYEAATMDTDATHTLEGTNVYIQVCSFGGRFFIIEDKLDAEGCIVEHLQASTLGLAQSLAIGLAKKLGQLPQDA